MCKVIFTVFGSLQFFSIPWGRFPLPFVTQVLGTHPRPMWLASCMLIIYLLLNATCSWSSVQIFWQFLLDTRDLLPPRPWKSYPRTVFATWGWKLWLLCPSTSDKLQVGNNKTSKMNSQYGLPLCSYFSSIFQPTSQILQWEMIHKYWQQCSMLRGGSGFKTSLPLTAHGELEASYVLPQRIIASLAEPEQLIPAVQ